MTKIRVEFGKLIRWMPSNTNGAFEISFIKDGKTYRYILPSLKTEENDFDYVEFDLDKLLTRSIDDKGNMGRST